MLLSYDTYNTSVLTPLNIATNHLIDAFAHQVRLMHECFGAYEPINFLALLIDYAISGE
jgi:hypothetical protein